MLENAGNIFWGGTRQTVHNHMSSGATLLNDGVVLHVHAWLKCLSAFPNKMPLLLLDVRQVQ